MVVAGWGGRPRRFGEARGLHYIGYRLIPLALALHARRGVPLPPAPCVIIFVAVATVATVAIVARMIRPRRVDVGVRHAGIANSYLLEAPRIRKHVCRGCSARLARDSGPHEADTVDRAVGADDLATLAAVMLAEDEREGAAADWAAGDFVVGLPMGR